MFTFRTLAAAALIAGLVPVASAQPLPDPGSALIYTVHRSGPDYFTVISVTNSNTTPATPNSFGGTVGLHFEYANVVKNTDPLNPDADFLPLNCVVFNRHEILTPADTLSVVTACHNAVSPGGMEGFLLITAEDPGDFDDAIDHDYLMGSELVINSSGGMYSINAIAFDAKKDPVSTITSFNDSEYQDIPDVLYIDSFIALAGSQLALLNLTGSPTDVNTVQFTVWNDNEFALSSTRIFKCWFDQPLHKVSPLFEESFLKNSTPHDPAELALSCGGETTVETGWAKIDSINVSTMGGLHVSDDGALLGSITTGPTSVVDGGRLLWGSDNDQQNGKLFKP